MMSGIRGKDTQPELVLRKGLFRLGIRFRLHVASLPGRPDIVIGKSRVAILVHGCFWHSHHGCSYFKVPGTNRGFWEKKLRENQDRDARNLLALQSAGWRIALVWECATRVAPDDVVSLVAGFLKSNRAFIEISADSYGGELRSEFRAA